MAGTHSAIEGAVKLRAMPGVSVDTIKEIRIGVTEAMLHHGGFKLERPATAIGAQMSHCYVVAVTLINGTPSVPLFSSGRSVAVVVGRTRTLAGSRLPLRSPDHNVPEIKLARNLLDSGS